MTMITVQTKHDLADIANPSRNFGINPVIDDGPVVPGLVISMKKTGAWTKWMGRVVDKKGKAVMDEEFYDKLAKTGKLPKSYGFQLCYGHNSWRATQLADIDEIMIDVRPFADDAMVQMMAFENKNDAKGNMMVIIETVKQVGSFLAESIEPYKDFKSYKDDGGTFFSKKGSFDNAKAQGIGFKTILKMLEGWSSGDVQNTHRVLGDLAAGFYTQDQIANMPSVAVLGQFSLLTKAIREQTWPDYFKDKAVADVSDLIQDAAVSTTTKILKNTISALKDGKDPIKYVRSTQRVDFNLVKATKDLVFENMDQPDLSTKDLKDMDGFKEYEELEDLVAQVDTSIKKTLSARDSGEDHDDSQDGLPDVPPDTGADAGDEVPKLPELPPVEEGGDDQVEMPTNVLVDHYIRGAEYLAPLSAKLVERSTETVVEKDFLAAVEANLSASINLIYANYDTDDAAAIIDQLVSDATE